MASHGNELENAVEIDAILGAQQRREVYTALETLSKSSLDVLRKLTTTPEQLARLFVGFFREVDAKQRTATAATALVGGTDLGGHKVAALNASGYIVGDLMRAATNGDVHRARELLELGLNPNATAESLADWHSLHYAAQHGHAAMCKLLHEHGADIFAKDHNNETPLMQAG